jgi:heme-degrading monooxygenase HmoA
MSEHSVRAFASRQRARVLLYCRAPEGDPTPIESAYHEISSELKETAGLLGNELLREVLEPDTFVVLSEWESLAAFRDWESGAGHRGTTSPLRRYQDRSRGRPFGLYEVTATY